MPTYVLIWIVITHGPQANLPQSVATHSQEFADANACAAARDALIDSTHTASDKVKEVVRADKKQPPDTKAIFALYSIEAEVIAHCFRKGTN